MFFRKPKADNPRQGAADQAVALFREGVNCTQALVGTYGPPLGLEREQGLKVAGAFGSGMGMGETCGSVTGALMVIGLKHAKVSGVRFLSRERTDAVSRKFLGDFKARNGSTSCKELLGCDVSTPEGYRAAKQDKHFKQRCPKYVQDAAELLEEVLRD